MGEAVAKRIDEYLYMKGITLYRLAKDACLPVSTLQNLYRGHTKSPTLSLVFRIAEAMGITVEEFLSGPLFSYENLELD